MLVGVEGVRIDRQFHLQLAKTRQTNIGNPHISTYPVAILLLLLHGSTAQNENLRTVHARHTADQLTLAALGLLQIVGTI